MAFAANNRDFNEAVASHQRGDLRQAERAYRKILKKNPHFMNAYQNLGMLLVEDNRQADGIRVMERGLEMDPRHSGLLSLLSNVFQQMGQMEAAKKHAQAMVTYHPEKAEAYYNLALYHQQSEESDQAMKLLDKAIELNMSFHQAYYNKGLLHYQDRELEKSKKCFETTLSIDPSLNAARVNLGRVEAELGDYKAAATVLAKALEKEPNHANAHTNMGMVKHLTSDMAGAEKHLKKALDLGADTSELHTLLGNVYRDLGDEKKSLSHYEKALDLDKDNELAKRNIDSFNGAQIAAWHFEMMADGGRNRAYHKAIKETVKEGDVVFDIGAGAGLLSLMAAKAGARKVLAIELMDVIADTAQKIVKDNGYEDTIEVIQKRSTSMIEGVDFNEKADVIVSEILDGGLLGEGVIPTVRHARKNLLKPGGRIIPKAADIICQAIEVDDLKRTYPLKTIEGFDMSAFARFSNKEEYRAINLLVRPHNMLSEAKAVRNFDFEALDDISAVSNSTKVPFSLEITDDGELQGIAFWFDLYINDTTTASSGPGGEMIHWNQAVHFFKEPFEVRKGDTLDFNICNSENRIWFEPLNTQ